MKARTALLVAGLMVSIVASMLPAQSAAGSQTATYVASYGLKGSNVAVPQAGVAAALGGYTFTPNGDPSSITIKDATESPIPWVACQEGPSQDGETPAQCGGGDDITAQGCSTGGSQALPAALRANVVVNVFIFATNEGGVWVAPVCEGIGTTGTVTLRWV